jgi:hypothetical protein
MATYQLLRCLIALAGDKDNVVSRDRGRPVTYPELPILLHLHGEDAVADIAVVGTCEMSGDEMLMRVRQIYGDDAVKAVYPGTRPRLPAGDPSLPLCTRPVFVAPPTRPANPDPVLRPIDALMPPPGTEIIQRELAAESDPTDEEILRNIQADPDEDMIEELEAPRGDDEVDLAAALRPAVPVGQVVGYAGGPGTRPKVSDQPQTRVDFRGQARQAREPLAHLPDVSGDKVRQPTRQGGHDHDRPRG